MIDIAINPNTKVPSVAIRMTGYFGVAQDGIKLVDSENVFPAHTVTKIAELPSDALDTFQLQTEITDEKQIKDRPWLFKSGISGNPKGRPKGTSKTPLADFMREVAEQKHYEIKGTGKRIRAYELMAEIVVDEIVQKKNHKMLETFLDRTEGKVTQGVRMSGAIATASTEDSLKRIREIFPDDYAPSK